MLPSLPPLISTAPVGLHTTASTIALGSLQAYRRSPPCTSQTMSSPLPLLPPPLASRVPSGLQATLMTMPRCPCSEARSRPSEASHRHTLPSSPLLASWVPSGLHATRRILVGCARPTHRRVPVVTSHTCTPLLIARTGQKLSIRTPRHAIEAGVDVVGVPQELHSGSRGRVPHPDGIVLSATGQKPPIGTPRHPMHDPAMAEQQPGWRRALHIPESHQCIRARTGEPGASGTPGHVVERDRVALHDVYTLPTRHIPHLYGAIITPTEQDAAIRREGEAMDSGRMPLQRHAIATAFD